VGDERQVDQDPEHDPVVGPRDPAAADRERVVVPGGTEHLRPERHQGVIDHDADWRVRVDQHGDDKDVLTAEEDGPSSS
jgi:hypothetical protein